MWTIFNRRGKAVANCDAQPDQDDLAARGERAVYHQDVIPLAEAKLDGDVVGRKPLVTLEAALNGLSAIVSVSCSDTVISQIPLFIGGTTVLKPPGDFTLDGEPGIRLVIDFDRGLFRGDSLEVLFDG